MITIFTDQRRMREMVHYLIGLRPTSDKIDRLKPKEVRNDTQNFVNFHNSCCLPFTNVFYIGNFYYGKIKSIMQVHISWLAMKFNY